LISKEERGCGFIENGGQESGMQIYGEVVLDDFKYYYVGDKDI
jgi:hypothetical protein